MLNNLSGGSFLGRIEYMRCGLLRAMIPASVSPSVMTHAGDCSASVYQTAPRYRHDAAVTTLL